ncbi:MAG TPA: TonB-dependent receptor [Candidatus Acidoferrum sp.]|nr:TonB-dependent receptor [Candidatus Acidoferrum sp.]
MAALTSRHKTLAACIALIAASCRTAAAAPETDNPVEEIVVISSRIPESLRQVPTSVSVVTETDLEAHGNLSLTDVLRQLPAIATSNNGGAGKTTTLRIRGEDGFRTLTIFDGMRLSDPSGTQISAPLEHIMSSGIGRVEVLRGPQGLSYGADAGGVINISTRQNGTGLSGGLDLEAGRYDTQQISGNLGGGNDKVDFFVSGSNFSTAGFNTQTADTVLRDRDGYDNTTWHGRIGFNFDEHWRVELVHHNVDGDTQFDGCYLTSTVYDCRATYKLNASRAAVEYKGDGISQSLSYSTTDSKNEDFSAGVSTFTAHGKLDRWEYVGSATNLPGFDLVYGADFEKDSNDGKGRDNKGAYVEYLSDFSKVWHFTVGTRYDDNDDFGSNTSYRLGASYLYDLAGGDTVKYKTSYGTGFRAPSPYEIAYNSGPYTYPPASLVKLKQEKSKGYDVGVEYLTHRNLHLEATYFNQEIEDSIFFDLAAYSGYLQDTGTSKSQGIELDAELGVSDHLDLRANYTYDDSKRPNGLQRLRVPKQLANAGLSWHVMEDKLHVNLFYRAARDAIDQSGSKIVQLSDFDVIDLTTSYDFTGNLQGYVRLENAFDEKYQEVTGYNTPGAALYVGVRYRLGR